MEQRVLILCDPEEDYAQRMSDYMRRDKFFPWMVKVYTHVAQLHECAKLHSRDMLVISESVYQEDVQKLGAGKTVILNETGIVKDQKLNNVNKYQEAEKVIQQLKELGGVNGRMLEESIGAKLIGLYSPIRRCLQTSFGLCLGRLLSQKGKTLYLSFEQYSGVEGMQSCDGVDLSSLLYLLADEDKFMASARRQIRREENFEYVSTMVNPQNLLMIGAEEWKRLLYQLQTCLGYEYIILDLSESVQGLFDILRMCVRVYSMAKDDPIAKRKLDQYEQLLSLMEYGDVREKTSICRLPLFRNIPTSIAAASKGDLADYVRKLVEKEEWY
ncbi:MAG: hypothetical protein IJZ82_11055 [Lachnospiraceae bacterium]|nr:hypothetical protein [Lachnospiraceae bacterium]